VVWVTVVPVVPVVPVGNNSHCNYWHHWHNSYSDHWNNGKYHRAIHSYIAINGEKHCRNNCHW
jgi:hypothetical protein